MATARRKAPARAPAKDTNEPREPLIFTGPPGRMCAEVTIANTGERRLAVRALTVSRDGSADVEVQTAALVAPGTTASMTVTVPMDPATSPGDYPAQVQVAGIRRAAVLRVGSNLAMHLTPRRVLAEVGTHTVSFVAVNEGNVDVPLAVVTRGRTSDGGEEAGPDVTLTLPEPVVLAAASTLSLQGRLKVPPTLEPTRRHTASVPVGLADLEVIILARTAETEAKP